MVITAFPPVSEANEYGLLGVGGDLEIESLVLAYRSGVFPWPVFQEDVLTWFAPPLRALLFFDRFHISRSLQKRLRSTTLRYSFDTAFPQVIERCASAKNRKGQAGTWISPEICQAYIQLHGAGYAHSIECWNGSQLVGGVYGVAIGQMFAGESMFHSETDASKLALCWLVEHLSKQGVTWLDCQQLTPLLESFGAEEVSREDFMELLATAVNQPAQLVFR